MQELVSISPCVEGKEEPFKFTIIKKSKKKCTTGKKKQGDHLILIDTCLKDRHIKLYLGNCKNLFRERVSS